MGGLPVTIRLGSLNELVFIMILHTKAQLADGDLWTNDTLKLRIILQYSLARVTFETWTLVSTTSNFRTLRFFLSTCTALSISTFYCSINHHLYRGSLVILHSCIFLLIAPHLSVLFKNLKAHRPPIRTAKRAIEWFTILNIVFKAPRQTVCMNLASAAVATVG